MRQAADEARPERARPVPGRRRAPHGRSRATPARSPPPQRASAPTTTSPRLGEWETAEIARIRRETEEGITARHGRLETELAEQTMQSRGGARARPGSASRASKREMDTFFQRLLQEEGSVHVRRHGRAAAGAADVRGRGSPTTGDDRADAALEMWAGEPTPDWIRRRPADPTRSTPDPDAGMPAMQAGDFAAAEAEAAEWIATGRAGGRDRDRRHAATPDGDRRRRG